VTIPGVVVTLFGPIQHPSCPRRVRFKLAVPILERAEGNRIAGCRVSRNNLLQTLAVMGRESRAYPSTLIHHPVLATRLSRRRSRSRRVYESDRASVGRYDECAKMNRYLLLADGVAVFHAAYVAFVTIGFALIAAES